MLPMKPVDNRPKVRVKAILMLSRLLRFVRMAALLAAASAFVVQRYARARPAVIPTVEMNVGSYRCSNPSGCFSAARMTRSGSYRDGRSAAPSGGSLRSIADIRNRMAAVRHSPVTRTDEAGGSDRPMSSPLQSHR